MLTTVNEKIFNIVLDKLNANTKGVKFDGNFIFKFWQQPSKDVLDFHIIKESETLEYEAHEIVPFVDVSYIEIPFNEKNRRSDAELEYYVAIKVEYKNDSNGQPVIEFDTEDDRYQAMLETIDNMRNELTYTGEGMKVSFKVKEPQKVNVFKFNKHYYQLFALSFNAVKIDVGRFGNEMQLSMGDVGGTLAELDTLETTVIMGKTERDNHNTTALDRTIVILNRTFEIQTTINYRGTPIDNKILQEVMISGSAENSNNNNYDVEMKQLTDFNIKRPMTITGGTMRFKNNAVETITFSLKGV